MIELYKKKFTEVQKVNFDIDALVAKVSKMTARNDHKNSVITVANAFKYTKYEKLFNLIAQINKIEGYTPDEINKYDYRLYKEMLKLIEKEYGKDVYDKIHGSL